MFQAIKTLLKNVFYILLNDNSNESFIVLDINFICNVCLWTI